MCPIWRLCYVPPVGYTILDHKALLTDIWAVFASSTLWEEFAHTGIGQLRADGLGDLLELPGDDGNRVLTSRGG